MSHGVAQTISELGNFLMTKHRFENISDPFGRSPSREVNSVALQAPCSCIAGLSDARGIGVWLAAAMKNAFMPVSAEVAKLEWFVAKTVWGDLQYASETNVFGVKKSAFYYEPGPGYKYSTSLNWGNWWSWNKANSDAFDRAYDYVHVTALYLSLYRLGRNYPGTLKTQTWQWYLSQALNTVLFATNGRIGYADVGLMGETVFCYLLDDLTREGLSSNAAVLEVRMKADATRWG